MKIRFLTKDDSVDEVNELLKQLSPNARFLNSIDDMVMQKRDQFECVVGVSDERIIAMGCVTKRYVQSRGVVVTFEDIVVHEDARGQGHGDVIMKMLFELAINEYHADCIELTSNDHRKPAQKMYEKHGFEKIDTAFYRKKIL